MQSVALGLHQVRHGHGTKPRPQGRTETAHDGDPVGAKGDELRRKAIDMAGGEFHQVPRRFVAGGSMVQTVLVGGVVLVSEGHHRARATIADRYRKAVTRLVRT